MQKSFQKKNNKIVGLCHGVFDILHLGHIEHFREAKKNCDYLICSITADKFVKKGPGQPLNSEKERLKFLQSIKLIDKVVIVNSDSAVEIINQIKPDYYFKGADYKTKNSDTLGNLKKEQNAIKKINGKIFITNTSIKSSTKLYNKFFAKYSSEQKKFIKRLSDKYNGNDLKKIYENISKLEINLIGEVILDEYIFCDVIGTSTKDPCLSVKVISNDIHGGGIISVANLLSPFVKKINLITNNNKNENIRKYFLGKNIFLKPLPFIGIYQKKTRYLTTNRFNKVFQTSNVTSYNYDNQSIIRHLNKIIDNLNFKNILLYDFGLGMFDIDLTNFIKKKLKNKIYLGVNVQTNSNNYGFNTIGKYNYANLISLDLNEYRLFLKNKELDYLSIIKKFRNQKNIKFQKANITLNKNGSVFFSGNYKVENKFIIKSPVFSNKIIDTTGCGDAYFAMNFILNLIKCPNDLNVYLSNCFAGMYSEILGNSKNIKKNDFLKYVESIIKIY